MPEYLLVSTQISISEIQDNRKILYLGEWAKKYGLNFNRNLSLTLEHHWSDLEKLKKDNIYLATKYEELITILSQRLNKIHQLDLSKQSWEIIIGPFLVYFIGTIWDRWEIIQTLQSSKIQCEYIHNKIKVLDTPKTNLDFNNTVGNDVWNEYVFSRILEFLKPANVKLCHKIQPGDEIKLRHNVSNKIDSRIKLFLKEILIKIEILFYKFYKKHDFLFFETYFPLSFERKLNKALSKVPFRNSFFNKMPKFHPKKDSKTRNNLFSLRANSKFETILNQFLIEFFPLSYLEGLPSFIKHQRSYPSAKNILTANGHFFNENFKIWSAFQVRDKSNLFISSHGGSIQPEINNFNLQERISTSRFVWGKAWQLNQIAMPANKLIDFKKKFNPNGYISIIGYDNLRYEYRCVSAATGVGVLRSFEQLNTFLKESISKNFFKKILYKSKPIDLSKSWQIKQRIQDAFGKHIIADTQNINETIQDSKLVICTYPMTTLAECMISGVPTTLLINKDDWLFSDIYTRLLEVLESAKILHFDPIKLSSHIQEIENDIESWWYSAQVQDARKLFLSLCAQADKDPLQAWQSFFQKLDN
tara:strand:- start:21458 stop:23221 length:1764 start_codon:yes stop_codon:yes gene_type:complete